MAAMFELAKASNGEFRFTLKAANGQPIGTSQMYSSASAMEDGIAAVKAAAPKAVPTPIESAHVGALPDTP